MPTLSMNMLGAMHARETGKVAVFLLRITHPKLKPDILLSTDSKRLSDDPLVYGTRSRGENYIYVGAKVTIPDDKDRAPPTSKITILDINQTLVPMTRGIQSPPPKLKLELVLADDPDLVELSMPNLDMINVDGTRESLTFECVLDLLLNEGYPAYSFIPAYFPGLFQ